MPSPTQRTWVWVSSGRRWWTKRPGVLQSMGSHRVRHQLLKWTPQQQNHYLHLHFRDQVPSWDFARELRSYFGSCTSSRWFFWNSILNERGLFNKMVCSKANIPQSLVFTVLVIQIQNRVSDFTIIMHLLHYRPSLWIFVSQSCFIFLYLYIIFS